MVTLRHHLTTTISTVGKVSFAIRLEISAAAAVVATATAVISGIIYTAAAVGRERDMLRWLNNNFRGIDNAVCTLGYQGAQHASNLSAQMAQCCCDTRAAIKDVGVGIERAGWNLSKQISDGFCNEEKMNMQNRFDAQAYNCNTLQAIDKLGDRIIDYMSNEKVQSLRDENQALRLAASQERQNQYLISQLGYQCPKPAYVVQPPQQVTFPTNCCGGVNYAGYSNSCGCGCGCN